MKRKLQTTTKKRIGIIALAFVASAFPLFAQFTNTEQKTMSLTDAAVGTPGVNEYELEGFEHKRVKNLWSNPSDFKSAFNEYDGSKFNIGYVVGSNMFNEKRMGSNDWVTPSECNTWFSVTDVDKIKLNVIQSTQNAHYAISYNASDFNSTTVEDPKLIDGHGFEFFKTDIETGLTRINHGLSKLKVAPGSSHNTQELAGVLDLKKSTPGHDVWLYDYPTPGNGLWYVNDIGDISDYEPFTIKIGINQNTSDLKIRDHDLWFTFPRWNVIGERPSESKGNESFHAVEANTTHWKQLSGGRGNPIKREGLIFTLVKDPASGHVGIYSGDTTIKQPTINVSMTEKLKGMLPSEAIDLMFSGQLPLFTQESTQSFPGAIYGDTTYKITTDDNLGKITIEYKPGSVLHYGQVEDYKGSAFTWNFYGFGITKMNSLMNPKLHSLDVGTDYNEKNHIIDIFSLPSAVPEPAIRKYVFDHVKNQFVNPPVNFNENDISVTYIPFDSQKRILINSITLKRVRISTSDGSLADAVYSLKNETDFYLYGFRDRPDAPPFVTFDDFRSQVWLDGSQFKMIPEVLFNTIKSGGNQKINEAVAKAAKNSVSFNSDYVWNDARSTYRIADLKILSNRVDGLMKGAPQIQASIKVLNLDNKTGGSSSYTMDLYVYNCPIVLDNNLNKNIPTEISVSTINPQLAYMSKSDFASSGISLLEDYLSNQYNENRKNTSIPYATISNLTITDVRDKPSLIVSYDVNNMLESNDRGDNPNYLLSNKKGIEITLNNFYTPPKIDDTIDLKTTTFIGSHTMPINTSTEMSSKFASDFISNPNAANIITDFALTGEKFYTLFKDLPDDYRTAKKLPIVLPNSFVADDIQGTLNVSFALTYALINGEKVSNSSGTSVIDTLVLTGFKTTKSIPSVNNETILINEQSGDADYKNLFKSWFATWVQNKLLNTNNLSDSGKREVRRIIDGGSYEVNMTGLSFNPTTNTSTFLVKVPELSLRVPSLGFEFSNGFNINFQTRKAYLANTVTQLHDGHISRTYKDFKKDLVTVNYTNLIEVNNALPLDSKVSIRLNPYNDVTNSAIIEFKFNKFYSDIGMVQDYVIAFSFTFIPETNTSLGSYLVDSLTKDQLLKAVGINPITPLTASQIAYEFKNTPEYQEQINSLINSETFTNIVYQQKPPKLSPLSCDEIVLKDPTTIELVIALGNGMHEGITITGLNQALPSTVDIVPILNSDITFENIKNTFKDLRPSEVNEKAKDFIQTSSLPVGAMITNAKVFNVGIDSTGSKVAYINFTFNRFFVNTNHGVILYPNYVVQIKLNFDKTYILSTITKMWADDQINNNQNYNTVVISTTVSLLLIAIAISGGIFLYKKKKGGR